MNRDTLWPFLGLLLIAGAIFMHAQNGRYVFARSASDEHLTYAKLDTRTGEAWVCGADMDACIPMTDKAAYLAYLEKSIGRARVEFDQQPTPVDPLTQINELKAKHPKLAEDINFLSRGGFGYDEIKRWVDEHEHGK
jgi:hypothetical protein